MSSPKDQLIQTLGDSVSQVDQERVRYATKQLEEWRTQPGFFSTLQEIFLDSNIPEGIRFQSIIYLKNNIDRYWRKTAKPVIGDDEKIVIRQGFLHPITMHLPKPWLDTNTYAIGRIARHDFPQFWPDLVSQLLTTVRTAFEIEGGGGGEQWRTENALKGLASVIKELSSVRLGAAVTAFREITPEVFKFLGSVYQHTTRQCIEQLPAESPQMAVGIKILGIMKNLLVYGFDKAGERADSQVFFDIAVTHLREFYQLYNNLHGHSQQAVLRHISKLMKLFAAFASERPFEFLIIQQAPLMVTTFVQICQHNAEQFNKPRSDDEAAEKRLAVLGKIVINGISTIRSLLRVVSDPNILDKERQSRPEQVAAASSTLQAIFDSTNVSELAVLLLEHFLILRQSDLAAWQEDPEEWVLEVAGEVVSAESGLRVAGEALFMELVSNYKEDMLKFIAHSVQNLQHTDMTAEQIIVRESVYNAITLNALALYDLVDFDEWLISVIPAELSYNGPHNNIIRRRMALLISEWVGTKCGETSRPKVYETLLNLLTPLDPRNDIVVRLSAALAFRYAVDEWNFKVGDFIPYLDAVLIGTPQEQEKGGLIGLMRDVQHIEARVKLIQVVDVIVERMDRRITSYVPAIMNLLPYLWEQSEEQRIFRAAVLHSLKILTGALGEQSIEYHPFMVQLIALGTDNTRQDEFIYLYEEALDLWEEAVKNAPTEVSAEEPMTGPTYNLMGLFPTAVACLQFGSDTLKKVLKIIEYYVILDPVGIMQRYANQLFAGFVDLGDLKAEANRMMMSVIEVAIQGCPIDVFFTTFVESGLFYKVIAIVVVDNESLIITWQYMNVLARMALQNPELLLHCVRSMDPSPDIVSRLVDRWAGQKFDSIGQAKSRKLNAMGLTALLPTNDPDVLANLQSIMNVWFNVLSEVRDSDGGEFYTLLYISDSSALIYWQDEEEDSGDFGGTYAPSAHEKRKRIFLQHDPVHTTNLKAFVKENLGLVEANVGGAERFQEGYLRSVDEALVDQMQSMLLS